jgi:hypothetical protein
MSTISAANITTANSTTPLTITNGNTSAGDIILPSEGGVVIGANSTVNAIIVSSGSTANVLVTNSTGLHISTTTNVSGNVNVDSGLLFVDGVNNRIGISNTTPDTNLTITGSANVSANVIVGNRVTANVFVGDVQFPYNSKVTVGGVAGVIGMAPASTRAAAGTLALTINRQYFIPFYVPYIATTTNLATEVTTLGTGAAARMNIYAADPLTGAPTGSPLGSDVVVSYASTGVKSGAFAVTLAPGIYWASLVCSVATTIRTVLGPAAIGVSTLGGSPAYAYVYGTLTYGTMGAVPASLTGVISTTQCPLMSIY